MGLLLWDGARAVTFGWGFVGTVARSGPRAANTKSVQMWTHSCTACMVGSMSTNPPAKSNFFICADTACRWAFGSGLAEKLNELVEELEGVRPALEYLSLIHISEPTRPY